LIITIKVKDITKDLININGNKFVNKIKKEKRNTFETKKQNIKNNSNKKTILTNKNQIYLKNIININQGKRL